jgi:hypothetical protein
LTGKLCSVSTAIVRRLDARRALLMQRLDAILEQRLLGVESSGRNQPETAQLSGSR